MKNGARTALLVSLIGNLLFVLAFFYLVHSLGGFHYLWFKVNNRGLSGVYQHRVEQFEFLPVEKKNIVFLGNSLIAEGEWPELLGSSSILNRGIPGDGINGVLSRLDPILDNSPRQLFLEIGINDLGFHAPERVWREYQELVKTIRSRAPETELFIMSLLPVNNQVRNTGRSNEVIRKLNEQLKELAQTEGAVYLDIHSGMTDPSGRLREELTQDGIHLNGEAYLIWRDALIPHVKR